MAKLLGFKRDTSEVVTVDSINNNLTAVGAALVDVETTTAFPGRTQNNLAIYRGDPHLLYLHNTNEIRLAAYKAGVWADVAGFTAIAPTGAGNMTPTCLRIVQDFLVAIVQESDGGADRIVARTSQDAIAWNAIDPRAMPTQPTTNQGGASVVWRNAVFVATNDGIIYYDPINAAWGASFDSGDDSFNQGVNIPIGSFTFWNNELYFAKPDTVPTIYQLDRDFDPNSPPASPMWENRLPTGIPGLGAVTVGPDTGTFLLFVNKVDELCLLYSAQLGTKLIKANAALFPLFDDVTTVVLDSSISNALNLGFALFVDDRRAVNELQSFLIVNPSSGDTQLASWDGVGAFLIRTTFIGVQLMPPDDRFGALRTFTNLQPSAHIRATSKPFPGRTQIDYTVRDASARPVDVFGEYSIDGDAWLPMTQGDGDSGNTQLVSTLVGSDYSFFWDAFSDLDGDYDFVFQRIVARISGV
jgi:hypothetical protein